MAAAGNGLAAVLYAPCTVTAKVGDGTQVKIVERTEYPFRDTVNLTVSTPKATRFPITLRIPGWCQGAVVEVNGKPLETDAKCGSYVTLGASGPMATSFPFVCR